MQLRLFFSLLILITAQSSCIKRDNSEFTDTPIIESYLSPGDYLKLNVNRQIPFSSNVTYSQDEINSLIITVKHNNTDYVLTSLGNGNYIDSTLVIEEDEQYSLSFTYNAKLVSAYTEIPLKPLNFTQSAKKISVMRMDSTSVLPTAGGGGWEMSDPVVLKWENNDASYYIVVVENMEETPDPVRDFGNDAPPEGSFRKTPTTSAGLTIRPQEFQYFGRHRLILYHILPDYASLYDDNTANSLNLTNPATSIMNGYGIFTGLNSDTLYLRVNEQ
jgi:hypothetical protein